MGVRTAQITLISLLCLVFVVVPGCAWESGTNHQEDAGDGDAHDAGGIDEGPFYPPGPYGTQYNDTVENFMVEEVRCPGGPAQGKPFHLEDFLGSKAILISVHSGTCTYCKQQAFTMESDLASYRTRGLKVLLILIGDDRGSSERQDLLDYSCTYRNQYGLTFPVAADPDVVVGRVLVDEGTPLNMLLDADMVVRYRVEALMPDTLEGNIDALLDE